ncbi:GntR family transcriptional regulator [Luteimonas sp. RD2P54]|uniref:GntR family transcriptional regulator n=1 Tax=Luteimonas endophytica TaxID=3042023 RepID=A0ABT6JCZ4_9GAMM|nr:GntR family transcriptional regulator [Luteimonas endophytica]MDH5824646.1 GntR family transcriptional regulator [Luteimonas endophytica]
MDPARLATQYRTSATPVRAALYRLVGEGLLEDRARRAARPAAHRDRAARPLRLDAAAAADGVRHRQLADRPAGRELGPCSSWSGRRPTKAESRRAEARK